MEQKIWKPISQAPSGFRDERPQEPLASYIAAYDSAEEVIDALLRSTGNLTTLQAEIADLSRCRVCSDALRYLAAPPL